MSEPTIDGLTDNNRFSSTLCHAHRRALRSVLREMDEAFIDAENDDRNDMSCLADLSAELMVLRERIRKAVSK